MPRSSDIHRKIASRPLPMAAVLIVALLAHSVAVMRDLRSRMTLADLLIVVPVAVACCWGFNQRRARQGNYGCVFDWTTFSGVLVALDLLLTFCGILSKQYWLVTSGLCCLGLAIFHASRDRYRHRRLTLLWLPLIPALSLSGTVDGTIRQGVLRWLQPLTSRVAHALSLPHYRDQGEFCLGDLRFSLADLSDGLGSPTAWIALTLLVIGLRRMALVPASLFLLASLSVWGLLMLTRGILGVSLLTYPGSLSDRDLQQLVFDVLLQGAGMLLWVSAGHAVFCLTHPISISPFAESRSDEFNLLTFFWNRLMGHAPERLAGPNRSWSRRPVSGSELSGLIMLLSCGALWLRWPWA